MAGLTSITGFFTSKAIPLLGGALALSIAGNVVLGLTAKHYAEQKVECKSAVVATTKAAEKTKRIVEVRQEKNIVKTQTDTTGRIADLTRQLRDSQSRERNLAEAQASTSRPSGESRAPVVLPGGTNGAFPEGFILVNRDTYYDDQRICVTNTVKAEDWQTFYGQQVNIWEEENVGQ